MSLHKLAEVTITVHGLPEHCGTDEQLQELTESAETLVQSISYEELLAKNVIKVSPELAGKVSVVVKGIHS